MNRPVTRAEKLADTPAAEFHARLDKLLPLVEAQAEEAEGLSHLTDPVDAALREAGVYAMLLPKEVGGPELSHFEAMKIVERLSYAHGSTGWCVLASVMELAVMAIFIGDEGIKKVFAKGPNVAMAGNGVPRGFAREVEGGYMIRGRWAYGSAIYHADWIHTGCFLTDPKTGEMIIGPGGQPKIVITHHPRSTIKLLGNWDVLGLRATGSFDYTIADAEELFVPSHLAYTFDTVVPVRGNAQGYLGLPGYSAWAHTGWGLGVGRRILDELVKVIVPRRDVFGMSAESASFKFQFAQAEARYRAARALAHDTWRGVSETCARGERPSLEQMTMVKLGLRHVHDVVSDVGTFAHRAARGASLHDTVMQRFYRDIHSGTQHILLADQMIEECGRALMGQTAPDAKWTVFGVAG